MHDFYIVCRKDVFENNIHNFAVFHKAGKPEKNPNQNIKKTTFLVRLASTGESKLNTISVNKFRREI